jgi:DNA repair protein RecN (Recombination protein N)
VLEKSVEKELSQLAMGKTRFRVSFKEWHESGEGEGSQENIVGTAKGIDEIEFLISPNPGEDLKALVKIASGGEISRIMLALKTVKAVDSRSKTLVFDEVDAGIGGQTADVVAQKLKRLSKHNQIICVTHLPQIASYADSHYSIQKRVEKGRTVTQVARLDEQDRVQEIARMMSGERVTESVLKHAAELLRAGSK